jgi:transcriptional adapter 2-alpha
MDIENKISKKIRRKDKKMCEMTFIPAGLSNPKIQKVKNTPTEILAWMPKRNEFEFEYDNDAEQLIAELTFAENEPEDDLKLKFKILDIYNKRLDEREKRKNFVVKRGLLDLKTLTLLDRNYSKEEKDICQLLKPLARFNSPEEHEELI